MNGKRINITPGAGQRACGTLRGMGINANHAVRDKIGIITDARIEGDALTISGFIRAADHPAEAARIQAEQADLGFSFEGHILASEPHTNPVLVTSLLFTGAAILRKDEAAYTATQINCSAERSTMHRIPRIHATGIGTNLTVGDPVDQVIPVARPLLQLFRKRGIDGPAAGSRLSSTQLATLLDGAGITERLTIKCLLDAHNLLPTKY
jgi:hypothetical protein